MLSLVFFFFFFNDTATTEIYTLSLHDALPICRGRVSVGDGRGHGIGVPEAGGAGLIGVGRDRLCAGVDLGPEGVHRRARDRKSTRLNSSHGYISYAVFCLKKKKGIHCSPSTSS